jgi:hypothetical protein
MDVGMKDFRISCASPRGEYRQPGTNAISIRASLPRAAPATGIYDDTPIHALGRFSPDDTLPRP